MASLDHIGLQIPAEKRLARVVKAAVSVVARGSGIPGGRADTFASTVARRFAVLASGNSSGGGMVSLSLEPALEALEVRLARGARGRSVVLRIRKARAGRRRLARRTAAGR